MVKDFRYEPNEDESLSMAVVSAVALAHHEGVLEQDWIISNDINPDALDGLSFAARESRRLRRA